MSMNSGIPTWETLGKYQIMVDEYGFAEFPPAQAPNQFLDFGKFKGRDFRSVFTQEHSYVRWSISHACVLTQKPGTCAQQWVKYIIGEVNNQGFERLGQPRNDCRSNREDEEKTTKTNTHDGVNSQCQLANHIMLAANVTDIMPTANVTEGAATTTVLADPVPIEGVTVKDL